MTIKKYQIDLNESKSKSTQKELIAPNKMPVRVTINKDTGEVQRELIGQRKVGEETKIYSAPEHYPRRTNEFGFLDEFEGRFDNWMNKSEEEK